MTEYLFSPPPGKDLIPFQEEGIISAHHILTDEQGDQAVDLQYEMGLGKSVVSMALAGLLFEDDLIDHVLVVAEANKVRDWAEDDFPSWTSLSVLRYAGTKAQRERMRKDLPQVIVMTYETGREDIAVFKHAKKSQGYAITGPGPLAEALKGKRVLVVFDECFVAGTQVDTPDGPRSIKDIVAGDVVFNATGTGRVLRTITKTSDRLVEVRVGGRTLHCSPRHPFFTARGLIWAQDLREGDLLCERDEAVRLVQGGAAEAEGNSVLLTSLLSAMAGNPGGDEEWESLYASPSDSAPRSRVEDQPGAQGERLEATGAGRKRARADFAPADSAGGAGRRLGGRASSRGRQGELGPGDAEELRAGLGLPGAQGRSGGGRPLPRHAEATGAGSPEGPVPGFTRVDGVQVLEPGSPEFDRLSGGADQVTLYDLEVEGHHSFSVEGLLVHNCTKLRSRDSRTHIAWNYLVNRWLRRRKDSSCMAMGLTGTKIESSPQDHYNVNRILAPGLSPLVKDFEAAYVDEVDEWSGKPLSWKNLDQATCEPGVVPLSRLYESITLRKRKHDLDVIGWFPAKVENPSRFIPMTPRQRTLYEDVIEALDDEDVMAGLTVLRQIAAHPMSLTLSQGSTAQAIVEAVGEPNLLAAGSAKTEAMLDWLREAGDQQAVIFTFFGQSVLPLLADRLRSENFSVVVNHGQMSSGERQQAQRTFKGGDAQVFLSSDAGARGLNLGVGSVLLHYDLPLLYSVYSQRSDRIHRADSVHPSVTVDSLLAAGTVEEGIFDLVMKRNRWSDQVLDDRDAGDEIGGSGYLTAADRRRLWDQARRLE